MLKWVQLEQLRGTKAAEKVAELVMCARGNIAQEHFRIKMHGVTVTSLCGVFNFTTFSRAFVPLSCPSCNMGVMRVMRVMWVDDG
jgi:hypothetical protein